MFVKEAHYLKDSMGKTYVFTRRTRLDGNGSPRWTDVIPCRAYARQTLHSIIESGSDPFHYRLLDLWHDTYERPWAPPRTLNQLVEDLATKIASGELKVYVADNPLWHMELPYVPRAGGGDADSDGSAGADSARTQDDSASAKNSDNGEKAKGGAGAIPLAASAVANVDPVEARKLRYQERQELLAATADDPDLQEANERLAFNNDNILRAEAAQYVYKVDEYERDHISELPRPPDGLVRVDPADIPGLEDAVFTSEETGFGAALFRSEINGETMLTYRGTNNKVTGKQDWPTNIKQGFGKETEQYNQAMDLARQHKQALDEPFSMVGHSLGGGLVSSGVAVTGNPGYTFNSAALHPNTAARRGGLNNEQVSERIQTQTVDGEILAIAQKHGGKALVGLGAGLGGGIGNFLGGPAGALLGATFGGSLAPDIPDAALGENHSLPSVEGGNPIERHSMVQVLAGIEAQKEQDIAVLNDGRK